MCTVCTYKPNQYHGRGSKMKPKYFFKLHTEDLHIPCVHVTA